MNTEPVVMSIAGFDPSGGAGILADIKTFEQIGARGFGVLTANTIQNDTEVKEVNWIKLKEILAQIDSLVERHKVDYFKIGIIENSEVFTVVKKHIIEHNDRAKIIWDPVLKSSSGYVLYKNESSVSESLKDIYLVTPNLPEFQEFFTDEKTIMADFADSNIFLKGGHSNENQGIDYLYSEGIKTVYRPENGMYYPKHGSGCVLSSAITAYLAKKYSLEAACEKGKRYVEKYLSSSHSLLGWHN